MQTRVLFEYTCSSTRGPTRTRAVNKIVLVPVKFLVPVRYQHRYPSRYRVRVVESVATCSNAGIGIPTRVARYWYVHYGGLVVTTESKLCTGMAICDNQIGRACMDVLEYLPEYGIVLEYVQVYVPVPVSISIYVILHERVAYYW